MMKSIGASHATQTARHALENQYLNALTARISWDISANPLKNLLQKIRMLATHARNMIQGYEHQQKVQNCNAMVFG
jgi:hypothetical protein